MNAFEGIGSSALVSVTGGVAWMAAARRAAIQFSAKQNRVDPSSIKATAASFIEKVRGVRYYGVSLDNREAVNVGLRGNPPRRYGINYVTDGL